MNRDQLTAAISALLESSQTAVVEAGQLNVHAPTWTAYMTTSMVLSNLAVALMAVRDKDQANDPS